MSKDVDNYIKQFPDEVQKPLQEVRSYIKAAAPNCQETINYEIAAFALVPGGKRDKQIMLAGYKKHIGFYPHPNTIEKFSDQMQTLGLKFAKGSVQFPIAKPMPQELILQMVKFRLAEIESE